MNYSHGFVSNQKNSAFYFKFTLEWDINIRGELWWGDRSMFWL